MQDKINQFDCFLNKTIIGTAKQYYIKENRLSKREEFYCYDTSRPSLLDDALFELDSTSIDNAETKLILDNAKKQLSEIEQTVVFLLFDEDLPLTDVAKILKLYDKTVSKIKKRALNKLKNLLKENL